MLISHSEAEIRQIGLDIIVLAEVDFLISNPSLTAWIVHNAPKASKNNASKLPSGTKGDQNGTQELPKI